MRKGRKKGRRGESLESGHGWGEERNKEGERESRENRTGQGSQRRLKGREMEKHDNMD